MSVENNTNQSTPGIDITTHQELVFEPSAEAAIRVYPPTFHSCLRERAGTHVRAQGNLCVVGEHIHDAARSIVQEARAAK